MDKSVLRIRALLERWFTVAAVALIVLAGIGGWATYNAYAAPGTYEEQRTVDQWSVEGTFSHQATVTEAARGTVFTPGSVVTNRSVYFQRVMPVLSGQFELSYVGSEPLDVQIQRQLVIQSTEPTRGDEQATVYWQQRQQLGTTEATVQPDQQTTVPFEINVSRTIQEAYNVSDRLESPGQIQTRLEVSIVAAPQGENTEEQRLTFALPIEAQSTIYQVDSGPRTETFSETEMVQVQDESKPLYSFGGPVVLLLGAIGGVGLWSMRSRESLALSENEREWLAYRDDRTDFDDWITTITPPDEVASYPTAEAATLADLVDFAIDTNNAVLTPPGEATYYVIHQGTKYQFRPPASPSERYGQHSPERTDIED